jgi:hypothetical protein
MKLPLRQQWVVRLNQPSLAAYRSMPVGGAYQAGEFFHRRKRSDRDIPLGTRHLHRTSVPGDANVFDPEDIKRRPSG